MDDPIGTFITACRDHGVSVTRTLPGELAGAIEEAIRPAAVSTPLPQDIAVGSIDGVTADPTWEDLDGAETGVTPAAFGIAATGSVILESTRDGTEPLSLYPEHHVVVLETGDLVTHLEAAFDRLNPMLADGADAILATGPSATADMGDLVVGAHGPQSVHVLLVEEEQ